MDLLSLTIKRAGKLLRDRELSVDELVEYYTERIAEKNGEVLSYLEVYSDLREQAKLAQAKLDDGSAGPLTGIPLAVKDNILLEGRLVTSASDIISNYRAVYDATVVKKLKEAGAVFLGRTNMDEFAMGSSTEKSARQVTKNPYDPTRVPGGSSGGSAAAVSAGLALAALGSDTGGSIRQPASLCGCVGLKPTYGAVSRFGLMAMGSSLDQIGPLAKTVDDAAEVFYGLEGEDPCDSTTLANAGRRIRQQQTESEWRIGVPWHLIDREGVDREVVDNFKQGIERLKGAGCKIEEITLPGVEYTLAAYYIIMQAEVSSNLARFDGMRYGLRQTGKDLMEEYLNSRSQFGSEPRMRSMLGTYVLSSGYYDAYYNKGYTARKLATADINKAFGGDEKSPAVDLIATPTSPTPAFKIGEKTDDPVQMMMADVFTVTANIAGVPAISVPAGSTDKEGVKLPIGFQLMAPALREDLLFMAGKMVYQKDL